MAQGEEDVAGTQEFVFVLKQMGQQLRAVSQSQAGRIPTYTLRNVTRAGQQLREWTREKVKSDIRRSTRDVWRILSKDSLLSILGS